MRKTCGFLTLVLLLATLSATAGELRPHRFNANSLDGALTTVVNRVTGDTWSVWEYRTGAEYDIAISVRDAQGFWSEPEFIGEGDRLDQVQPTLTADAAGNLYLAYVDRARGAVMLSARAANGSGWTSAFAVTAEGERGHHPTLRIVGDRLVVAFRAGAGIEIRDLPLLPAPIGTVWQRGVQDMPDPIDPVHRPRDGNNKPGSGGGSDEDPIRTIGYTPSDGR